MLQWNTLGCNSPPYIAAKINSISEITRGGMTVPVQGGGSMAVLQPPRSSKFMITDILGGNGKLRSNTDDEERTPSPSPQPRDLSLPPNNMRHHDDSDSDSSGMLDDHSICSNGKCLLI